MAIRFNGINQGVGTSPNGIGRNVTGITLSAWVNITSFTASSGILQIGTNVLGGASRFDLVIESSGVVTVGGRAPDSAARQSVTTTSPLATGQWYHLAGVIDVTNDIILIYVNGVLQATTGTVAFANSASDNTDSAAFNFGSNENNSGEFVNGVIDDPRIYHRLLTAGEVETIYACRGADSIYFGLQYRGGVLGVENAYVGIPNSIAISNVQGASTSTAGTSLGLSYTVPAGSDLTLVVVGSAESGSVTDVIPSGATFGATPLSLVVSAQAGDGSGGGAYAGIALFRLRVTAGVTNTITVTWASSATNMILHAYTLTNTQDRVEASVGVFNHTGNTTGSLTTLTDGALVVTGGVSGNPNVLSAVGTNHTLQNAQTPNTAAGAIGSVAVPTATTITGIGWTSSSTNRMAQVMASFPPTGSGSVYDLSNNELVGTPLNLPIYAATFLKSRKGWS